MSLNPKTQTPAGVALTAARACVHAAAGSVTAVVVGLGRLSGGGLVDGTWFFKHKSHAPACCTRQLAAHMCVVCAAQVLSASALLTARCVLLLAAAAEGQDPLAVIHDIMSRDLKPELDTMVLAAAAQKSAVPQL